MTQPVSVITPCDDQPPPPPPPQRLMSISSGPMSDGMIPSVRPEDGSVRRKTNSSEHICMFSVCLMFIGIPIIVIGILCLSIIAPFGIIMLIIGAGASVSGACLVILSGLVALFKKICGKCGKAEAEPEIGEEGQTPEIIIDDTLYSEHFSDNLCEEQPEQIPVSDLADLPNMEKLDPIYWSNYPEAQNPQSYLQSFGELPKVMPSPDNRYSTKKTSRYSKKSKKSSKKIGRKISESLGMGPKRKTMSRTSLTRDYSEEIQSDSSSSSLASTSSQKSTHRTKHYKISANGLGTDHSNQSVITIENAGQRTADGPRDEVLSTTSVDSTECYDSADQTNIKSVVKGQNEQVVNGILPDECTESIELTEIVDRDTETKTRYIKDEEFDDYSDLWNSIRSVNK